MNLIYESIKYRLQNSLNVIINLQNKDLNKLFEVISTLMNGEKLNMKYKDHTLSGKYKETHECHIEPDLVKIIEDTLVLFRIESHSELFK